MQRNNLDRTKQIVHSYEGLQLHIFHDTFKSDVLVVKYTYKCVFKKQHCFDDSSDFLNILYNVRY